MTLHNLAEMTWEEAGELGARRDTVALVPIGSTEQHGPHLPLFTDSLFAEALAKRVAEHLPLDVVVTPALHLGLSSHHLGFPGTVTLDSSTFEALVIAHVEAMRRVGIDRIAVFSGHGGNFAALGEIVARYREREPNCRVVAYSDLARFLALMMEAGRRAGVDAPETDVHAGALETSFALYLFPDLVREHDQVTGYVQGARGWLDRLLAEGARSLSDNGVFGQPSLATEAAGRRVIEDLVEELTSWMIRELELETRAEPIVDQASTRANP